jgi:response regulator of citrate/malate metabolism
MANILNKVDVLIVDDDKDICEIFTEYCKSMNVFNKIIVANDGSMATQKMQNQQFGIIVLDITMPKKNGVDVILREFSSNPKNKKESVLVVSGTLDQTIIARLVKGGFTNFLVKPVEEEVFKARLMKMIG